MDKELTPIRLAELFHYHYEKDAQKGINYLKQEIADLKLKENTINIDGLIVGGCMVRSYRDEIADLKKSVDSQRSAYCQIEQTKVDLRVEIATLKQQLANAKADLIAADYMAFAIDKSIKRHDIDTRSEIADCRLEYGTPFVYEYVKLPNDTKADREGLTPNNDDKDL